MIRSYLRLALTLVAVPALLAGLGVPARAQTNVVGWGDNSHGQCDVPALAANLTYIDVGAGKGHSAAVRSDGQIVEWGIPWGSPPQPPPGLIYVEVACGDAHTVARLSDGSVIAWGDNTYGQCDVPLPPPGIIYVAFAAGGKGYSAARLSDGSIVEWGAGWGIPPPPPPPPGLTYVGFPAWGARHIAWLLSDGSLIAWGSNTYGQCNVPPPPPGFAYVEVAAGGWYTVARRSDEQIVAWGDNTLGQCDIPTLPRGTTLGELAAGTDHSLVLVETLPCGLYSPYCTPPAPNSVSAGGALFSASGCASHATNSLVLDVVELPPNSPGLFFYGTQQTSTPYGNGNLCVTGQVTRVTPPVTTGSTGTVSHPVDLRQPPFSSGPGLVLPGTTWHFQFWYRDPAGSPTTFNLSNALQVVFAP